MIKNASTIMRYFAILGIIFCSGCGCATLSKEESSTTNNVVAVVNGKAITLNQLNARLRSLPRNSRINPNTSLGRRTILDNMINQELLLQEAKRAAIPEREDIREAISAQADQIILNQLIFEKFGQRLDVTDDEAKNYYESNKESFVVPERRHVRHILVEDEEIAKKVKKELSEGVDFSEMVEEYAIDTAKENDGDLGYIEKNNTILEFAEAAFNLNVNEISEPVKTKLGYHIIELLDIKEPEQLELENVTDAVKRLLMVQKRDALIGNWVNELKAKADISVKGSELARSANFGLETLDVGLKKENND